MLDERHLDDLLLERLLRVIDEGRRTATYKLALLTALIDAIAERPGSDHVPTSVIAERVVAAYFPQVREYVANDGIARELRQISMKTSPVARSVLALRLQADAAGCRSIYAVRDRLPDAYAETVRAVEDTFVRYPIPLLQVVGSTLVPFLYEADWPEGTSAATLRRQGRAVVRMLPAVADRLVVLGPLLRPLIQIHWARDVARWTGIPLEDDRLQAHLFGTDRVAFPSALRAGLVELQAGRCFYCAERLGGRVEVDHFLAWSRWPNDAIENLVAADRCNGAKRDHLAAERHLRRWWERLERHERLSDLAVAAGWPSDVVRSDALVRSTYAHVASGTPLWIRGSDFEVATGPIDQLLRR